MKRHWTLLVVMALGCSSDHTAGAGGTAGAPAGSGGISSGGTLGGGGTGSGTGGTSNGGGGVVNGTGGTNTGGTNTGGTSTGGTSTGGTSTGGTTTGSGSGMPVPPGSNVAQPSGAVGNLRVLDWAGFKGAISLSFDDALTSQIDHYAELQATGVRMTFYLVSNNNGTSPTWSQAARDGHELGNHTAHHCHDNGAGCAWGTYAGSLDAEDDQCTAHITQQFGTSDVWTAAAPYGDGGYSTPAQSRFLLNRIVGGGQIAPNDGTDPLALPCFLARRNETASGFNAATDSARTAGKWQIFLIHSLGGDGGFNPVSITDVVGAVDHAKSLGDVWIDSVVDVGAYWRAQKTFTGVTPATSGTTTTWTWTLPAHFPPGHFLRVTVSGGTLKQGNTTLTWDTHGYYEVALDAGSLTLSP